MNTAILSRKKSRSNRSGEKVYITKKRENRKRIQLCKMKCSDKFIETIDDCDLSDRLLSFRHCKNSKEQPTNYYVTPIKFSVDTLQYAFNTNRANLITDGKNKYLTLTDFPTLLFETATDSSFIDKSSKDGFYNIYEDSNTMERMPYETQLKHYLEKHICATAVMYDKNNIYKQSNKSKSDAQKSNIEAEYIQGNAIQDIAYVKKIAESLNKSNPEEYTCDLQGIPEKYIIIENIKITVKETEEEYVICGYPDPRIMRTYIEMLENETTKSEINKIHELHKTEFSQLFADMYNFVNPTNRIDDIKTNLYKFMGQGITRIYLEKWYSQYPKLKKWVQSLDYNKKLDDMTPENGLKTHKELIERDISKCLISEDKYEAESKNLKDIVFPEYDKYLNAFLLEYLNKPMLRVRYYFLIFRKDPQLGLIPAIFNIKQLEPKHKPILEKVLDLIETRIPSIFGILGSNSKLGNRYKLFHSYIKYMDFFNICTEYLHTISNFSHYSYIYKNRITLDELIYACGRISENGNSFWRDLKLEYDMRTFRIQDISTYYKSRQHHSSLPLKNNGNNNGNNGNNGNNENNENKNKSNNFLSLGRRKSLINSKKPSSKRKSKKTKPNEFQSLQGHILLIYETSFLEYIIIYKDNETHNIYVLEVKSNMKAIKEKLKQMMNSLPPLNVYTCNKSTYKILNYDGNVFIITNHTILDASWFNKNAFITHNPVLLKDVSYPKQNYRQNDMIDVNQVFSTPLIDLKFSNIYIQNLHLTKPIFYFNLMLNETYLDALKSYNAGTRIFESKFIENIDRTGIYNYGIYNKINCIINKNECGYNFIETYGKTKVVIWILPFNYQSNYIRNFTYLNKSHIPLLETLRDFYKKNNKLLFLHMTNSYTFNILHFHLINYDNYKKEYFVKEKDIYINDLINKITIDSTYYISYEIPILYNSI